MQGVCRLLPLDRHPGSRHWVGTWLKQPYQMSINKVQETVKLQKVNRVD